MGNRLTPPPGASSEGAVRGRGARILRTLIIGRRKKLICKLDDLILVFYILPTYRCQNDGFAAPPYAPRWSRHLSLFPYATPSLFWLVVGCKTINRRPSKARVHFFLFFFRRSNRRPNRCNSVPPHALPRPRLLSSIPPSAAADSYLIVVFFFKVLAT